ncbi:phage terminase large subunit [Tenacibaculum sp. 190524A05c]
MFFILEDIILNKPRVSNVLIYGGKSSSKTVSISQILAKRGLEKGESSLMFRKESARVKDTIKKSFNVGIDTTRLSEGWTRLDREFRSITGAEVLLKGLESEEKAKGVEGYSFVVFDELNQFLKEEYDQADLSLRGEKAKIFFATWNPVSKESWVKKELVDAYEWIDTEYELPHESSFVRISSCGTIILIRTMYEDNYWAVGSPCGTYGFVDEKLINKYKKLKTTNYEAYKVNVLGEWGNVDRGGEFYKEFDPNKHLNNTKYDPNSPLHISFDENVNPYLTLSVYQAKGLKSWKIDEICLEHPKNTLKHTLTEFKRRYPQNRETVYIYGDRTSLKQDTKLQKGQNFYTIIEDDLRSSGYTTKIRLPSKNPSVSARGNFINEIFRSNIFGIEYTINEKCVKTIDDYECVKEASDGTKSKEKTKNPKTGVTYEKYGHLTDTDDYFICEYYKLEYNKYLGKRKKGMVSKPINSQ